MNAAIMLRAQKGRNGQELFSFTMISIVALWLSPKAVEHLAGQNGNRQVVL